MTDFLKAEQLTSSKWRILAIPFGGEHKGGKDADGEFFSRNTDIKPDWFDRRPVIWHHGKDAVMQDSTIGTEDDLEVKADGWWATLWLDRGARYRDQIEAMIRAGKAYGSSGALGHLVKVAANGEILIWPHAEQTLTTAPINFLSRLEAAKALGDFADAGLPTFDLDSLKADLPADLVPETAEIVPVAAGDEAAIQQATSDPAREKAIRALAQLAPRLERLKNA